MSDAPVACEADASDARAIDVAEAADASEAALAEALAEAPVVQVEDAVGLARLRLLGDEPAPFEADLPEARVAVEGVADKLKELPQAYAAIKTIADVLNAGDVGDDEVVAKAAAEDVWTRGKRALVAFAHREAPKEQPDDEGFLARIRGAGKRLVG